MNFFRFSLGFQRDRLPSEFYGCGKITVLLAHRNGLFNK